MIDYNDLYDYLHNHPKFHDWLPQLEQDVQAGLDTGRYGDLPGWLDALERMPAPPARQVELKKQFRIESEADTATCQAIRESLQALIPWRKGPFEVAGTTIDTEWRSDWKWERIRRELAPLNGRLVLDVGCGNGYHGWRMLGDGAARVIGIDPSPRFVVQWAMIKQLAGRYPMDVLPLGIEKLPRELRAFDTTFSMGVFYHRRSPMDHLRELKSTLRQGGELVLETLIIEGEEGEVLVPPGRYAMMNNVWFLPSAPTLLAWLAKCGFKNPRLVDVNQTTTKEQRATDWMRFHSLENFLDPADPSLTAEGHPAPIRAVFVAESP